MKNTLIKEYIKKEGLEIERIVEDHSTYLYRFIKNMSKILTDEDIEEIISDVFVAIWNHKEQLKEDMPIEPYMIGITKNLIKNKYRTITFSMDIADYEDMMTECISVEDVMEEKETNEIIALALTSMQKIDNDIFVLYYYSACTTKEIAEKLKITESNVRTRLHRTRKEIRKKLIKGGYSNGR